MARSDLTDAGYRALFEASPTPLVAIDLDTGAVLVANEAAAALYGYPPAELAGLDGRELLFPEDS